MAQIGLGKGRVGSQRKGGANPEKVGPQRDTSAGGVDDKGRETTGNTSAQEVSTTKGEKQQATRLPDSFQ